MRKPITTYFMTSLALGLAIFARWLLDPVLLDTLPFITVFGAVAIAVWVGGWRQAAAAAIIGYLAIDYWLFVPRGSFLLQSTRGLATAAGFAISMAITIAFGEFARRYHRLAPDLVPASGLLRSPIAAAGDEAARLRRLGKRSAFGFFMVLLLLVVGSVSVNLNSGRLSRSQSLVLEAHDARLDIQRLLYQIQNVETGQRGFLLTGDETYLAPYDATRPSIDSCLTRLRALTAGDPELQPRVSRIEIAVRAKLAEMGETIALTRAGDREGAVALVETGRGKELMDEIRSGIAALDEGEQRLLTQRSQKAGGSYHRLLLWSTLEVAIGVLLIGMLIMLNARNLQERIASAELLAEQNERLRVTLGSIGDGVITTDPAENIAFLNPVAESLTGWSADEAAGKPLESVFRIVTESNRLPVESPARRALRKGVVVGLESHTVLISRAGVEHAIDDSAAVIRGVGGEVLGCVLVFRNVDDKRRDEQVMQSQLATARTLAAIVESSGDGIIGMSLQGVIQSWNPAAERLFGHRAQAAIGKHISLIIPADRRAKEELIFTRIRAGERVEHFETVRQRDDATRVHVSLTISPIMDEQGAVVGMSKTARDITDRKQNEAVISGLMQELKAGDQRKDVFLAILAHELRGPLAPLQNTLEIMKRTECTKPQLDQARSTMERQLGQLVRLVDDLLDVSRITRDRVELRREPVELASVVHQVVEATRQVAEASHHQLHVNLPPEPVYVFADPVRLMQILGNLLNNACKYTPAGGLVSLTVTHGDGKVTITVADTGMGIPAQKLESVFEMFTQIDRTLDRAEGGLGIGLTLVKRLTEMHGGTVVAYSDGIGKGSRFVVQLSELSGEAPPEPSDTVNLHPFFRRRILIVDDNVDSARSLATLLRMAGHEVHTAFDGLDALERADELQPSVLLLDIGLPRMSGHEVCRRIREHDWGRRVFIIAMTGWGQAEDRRRTKEAGFDHHMTKPAQFDSLMELLAKLPDAAID